jgi:NADH-quinone oxidoreductase subunit F
MPKLNSRADLVRHRKEVQSRTDPRQKQISVCTGTGCSSAGAQEVVCRLQEELGKQGGKCQSTVKVTGCHGFCERGPLVVIRPSGVLYNQVKADQTPRILAAAEADEVVSGLLYVDPVTQQPVTKEHDVPFYRHQQRMALGKNGLVDPREIDDYIALDGYDAMARTLAELTPAQVIETIKQSGLRGRGGAGFPTAAKWELAARNIAARRAAEASDDNGPSGYVVCNGDEGDPGAFMDRSILEGNPHGVLEGLIIGGYAVGARVGYFYIRGEYPLAIDYMTRAIQQATEQGLLGRNILGSGFDFEVKIARGSGAFVCGEETALIASIEGERGMPRPRPPYPVEVGLWGKPTVINNVKTWTYVPLVLQKGPEWFRNIGTPSSPGTAIFSLVGKVNNTGLVEVPMGVSLRHLVNDVGGGVPKGGKFKAVQTGGPSGGCIPAELLDTPVDYEALGRIGSMMGSGGMVVMDETTCMVDLARYFLSFTQNESCGKCAPCRLGTQRMLDILTRITEGKGAEEDLPLLEEFAATVKLTSLCGLGQTAPNPVLTTLRYFRHEYEAHVRDKKCPAKVCKALLTYTIDAALCKGCGLCIRACPAEAITGGKKQPHLVHEEVCVHCGACFAVCKFDAVQAE